MKKKMQLDTVKYFSENIRHKSFHIHKMYLSSSKEDHYLKYHISNNNFL